MSVILMTTLFYKALLLQGEIWCWSLLGIKGLKIWPESKGMTLNLPVMLSVIARRFRHSLTWQLCHAFALIAYDRVYKDRLEKMELLDLLD